MSLPENFTISATTPRDSAPESDLELKRWISGFISGFTVETTPGAAARTPDYRALLRSGTKVAVTFLPGSSFADTLATVRRLRAEGFEPLPHLAARSFPSRQAFEEGVAALVGEAGVEEAIVLAGAVPSPLGPFDSSMALLDTGVLDRHGIRRIGVAGHPEGSPDIRDEDIAAALAWKNAFAERSDAELYIVTQFCFEAAPLIAWDRRIQAEGNRLPIRIGLPGLATLKTLLAHARNCGIGPSMTFLVKQARNVARLMQVNAPDRLTLELARYQATDPNCGITGVHMYPLGGLKKTAAWSYAVAEGAFTLKRDRSGFELTQPLPPSS